METYTELKELTENPDYEAQRQRALAGLAGVVIDPPITGHIKVLNSLPWCFTLQSCYGHFLYKGQDDQYNIDPLPTTDSIDRVDYKIAYIALCIENSDAGRRLFEDLRTLTKIDPENIQFCCAEWFWDRQVNSYILKVEPDRFRHEDRVKLKYSEVLKIEMLRNELFSRLRDLVYLFLDNREFFYE